MRVIPAEHDEAFEQIPPSTKMMRSMKEKPALMEFLQTTILSRVDQRPAWRYQDGLNEY